MFGWYYARGRVNKINSKLASHLTHKRWDALFPLTVKLALYSIPASILGKCMSSLTQRIGLHIRVNLTNYYQNEYLKHSPYLLCHLLEHMDQRVTNDIDKFSHEFAELYNSILWSVGGVAMLSLSLMSKMGWKELITAIGYSYISRRIVTFLTPSFSDLTEGIQMNEARYRHTHSQVNEYVEEIEILNGGEIEQQLLNQYHDTCIEHYKNYYNCTMITEMFGSYFTGEIGNLVGYLAMIPAIYNGKYTKNESQDSEEDTVSYLTTVIQELAFLTKLFERVFRIGKSISEVNGLAHRIVQMEQVINGIVKNPKFSPKRSIITTQDCIEFIDVSVATPLGEVLVENLSFAIKPGRNVLLLLSEIGEHLVIVGPNGSGKTSLFRIIAGLWAPINGKIRAPHSMEQVFLLSQRPYMVPGLTLRQQLTYPKSSELFTDTQLKLRKSRKTREEEIKNKKNKRMEK
ncbi:ABC fatty acid transporter [Reticulomyxa filosa]|uniref:ABC fatty acid transporter n=1 Tax=Reticulomyxa filosa TaxID=46433 RepID=X6M1N7_RETFI|nr:ABC fatty acid transporter [Reticulomyxa filosa]|eukprot:ETO06865.1 ABC fatty acid transporter [Reticulomyxa filosa]